MVGFIFTGQGSQYAGMGKDLYETFPESRAVFDKADEVLGLGLKRLCFEGPADKLKTTSISQPAIVTVSIAAFEAFKARHNIKPKFAAGLSLGEYTALIAAGSLSFEDGLKLIRKRGEIMEDAASKCPGKMAAVLGLALGNIKEICASAKAEIANINSPGQVVISGRIEAVERAMDLCIEAGAKQVVALEVSGGFHSTLMLEASVELKVVLDTVGFTAPNIPVIANFTAKSEVSIPEVKENLTNQMYSSVRWEESMRFMLSEGLVKFFEFGPGKVLKGLMRQIDSSAQVINIEKKDDILSFSGN
ncbi:MAG: ACP S-malonyltransferase [Candidatus Omnitrophota bacterium]